MEKTSCVRKPSLIKVKWCVLFANDKVAKDLFILLIPIQSVTCSRIYFEIFIYFSCSLFSEKFSVKIYHIFIKHVEITKMGSIPIFDF